MKAFNPLLPHLCLDMLSTLNARKATGPDGIPAWVLKENADILASSVADIINSSYKKLIYQNHGKKQTLHQFQSRNLSVM